MHTKPSLQSTALPLASLLGSPQDSAETYNCIFHLRPHLSFVIIGFGNNRPGSEQETWKRLSGDREGPKTVNSPERSVLSFRNKRTPVSSFLSSENWLLLFDFKVKYTRPPVSVWALGVFPDAWEGLQHDQRLVYGNILSLVAGMATILFPII